MKNLVVLLAAILLVFITGCSADIPTTKPTAAATISSTNTTTGLPSAVTTSEQTTTDTSSLDDQVFINAITGSDLINTTVGNETDEFNIKIAKAVCDDFKNGNTLLQTGNDTAAVYTDLDRYQQGEFIGAAVGVYCLQYKGLLMPGSAS